MRQTSITRATLGRLPKYLNFLKSSETDGYISATAVAKALNLGEVQVRKDLNAVSGAGRPKVGYLKKELIANLESRLGIRAANSAVIVGAGRLGKALLGFEGFSEYGLEIIAAFDTSPSEIGKKISGKEILSVGELRSYCQLNDVKIGIITVPNEAAQETCDELLKNGITAVWNFAPVNLKVPETVALRQENLALSLAHLNLLINQQ